MAKNSHHYKIVRWIESLVESRPESGLAGRVRATITWNRIFHAVSYVKSSLWVVPLIAIVLEQIFVRVLHLVNDLIGWHFGLFALQGAETVLSAVVTLSLSFMVFTFGSLLVAIQVASGQLTPRIIATTLLQDNVVRGSVGLFVFTLVFALGTQMRIDKEVNQLPMLVSAILGFACMAAFLYLIDYAARLLRPVSIAGRIGEMGLDVIESVYRQPTRGKITAKKRDLGTPGGIVFHKGTSRSIVALNIRALVMAAKDSGGVIEFVPRVGDFLGVGEPLFHLYGGAAEIPDRKLRAAVAFGQERTVEQDPTFAFRILVDIAIKALSPAINDPTTAVLAIDQLHRLVRKVGQRHLHDDEVRDNEGKLRLILRTPNWEDFVHLSFSEIRHYGAGNLQIARRLRAMIENLGRTLPDHRQAALNIELDLLDRTIDRHYTFPEELALARIADTQGL